MTINKKRSLFIAIITFYLVSFSFTSSQENNSDKVLNLKQQIQKLEKQSAEYKNQINQKHKESETLKKELNILENQIAKLKVDILTTDRRIELATVEIKDLNKEIDKTQGEIDINKTLISELIKKLNSEERQDLATILLANPKISDFFNHLEHIKNLRDQLSSNLKSFVELKKELDGRKETAENKKIEMEVLNRKRENQKNASETTKIVKNDLVVQTKGQEQKYQELLSEVEKQKAEFYKELQELEDQAREQGIYIVQVKAAIPPKRTKLFKMPMDDYILTQGYGYTSFAKRGAYGGAPHNGLDMTGGPGTEIKSIGAGTVFAKGFNNAAGNWIAIRHDNDLVSVYGHMKEPALVLAGERVTENTVIGFEGATGFVTGFHLHLSLYHEFFTYIGPKTGQIYFNYFQGSLNPLDYM